MKAVGPAANGSVELATRGVAELGAELVREQSKTIHCIVWNLSQWPGRTFAVVVHALDCEVVVARTLSTYRRTRAGAHCIRIGNARAEERQIQYAGSKTSRRGETKILRVQSVVVAAK